MRRLLEDVGTIFYRELLHYKRQRMYILGQILLPVLLVVFLGLPIENMDPDGRFASFFASGIMMFTVSSGGMGGGYTLLADMQQGFLRPILVAPIARTSIVVGKILARLVLSLLLAVALFLIFLTFTDLELAYPALALTALAAITFGFVGLGILLATWLRHLESFRFFAVFITVPLYFLSSMFVPVRSMPTPMRLLASANPLTYGIDLFRYSVTRFHEFNLWLDALVVLAFAAVMTRVAAFAFERRLTQ